MIILALTEAKLPCHALFTKICLKHPASFSRQMVVGNRHDFVPERYHYESGFILSLKISG